eukprot:scaffold97872_cov50-Attheya_sp.AAC.2
MDSFYSTAPTTEGWEGVTLLLKPTHWTGIYPVSVFEDSTTIAERSTANGSIKPSNSLEKCAGAIKGA